MAKYKFNKTEGLGDVAQVTKLFCTIGADSSVDEKSLQIAAGGKWYSKLCGFELKSKDPNSPYPIFQIAFVCKIRSRIAKKALSNPSQWYILKPISPNRLDALSKDLLKTMYQFDIDKFFESDMFEAALSRFDSTLKNGLEQAQKFLFDKKFVAKKKFKTLSGGSAERIVPVADDGMMYMQFIDAIKEAIPMIPNTRCYNDYTKFGPGDQAKVNTAISKEIKDKVLDAKLKRSKAGSEAFMAQLAAWNDKNSDDFIRRKAKAAAGLDDEE